MCDVRKKRKLRSFPNFKILKLKNDVENKNNFKKFNLIFFFFIFFDAIKIPFYLCFLHINPKRPRKEEENEQFLFFIWLTIFENNFKYWKIQICVILNFQIRTAYTYYVYVLDAICLYIQSSLNLDITFNNT